MKKFLVFALLVVLAISCVAGNDLGGVVVDNILALGLQNLIANVGNNIQAFCSLNSCILVVQSNVVIGQRLQELVHGVHVIAAQHGLGKGDLVELLGCKHSVLPFCIGCPRESGRTSCILALCIHVPTRGT